MAKTPQKQPSQVPPSKPASPEGKNPAAQKAKPEQTGKQSVAQPERTEPVRAPAEDSIFSERDAEMREEQQPPRKQQPRASEL